MIQNINQFNPRQSQWIGAAIAGGAALIGGLTSAFSNKSASSKSNKTNLQLAEYQNEANKAYQQREFEFNSKQSELEYQRNLEKWQMENEYNSPAAQMQRYQEAGLNPNLIYGTGSASAGNASAAPAYTAARYKAPHAERATVNPERFEFDPYQSIQVYNALSLQRAQVDNLAAQADLTKQEVLNRRIDNNIKAEQLTGHKLSNREKDTLYPILTERASIENRRLSNQADLLRESTYKLRNEINHLQPLQREKLFQEVLNLRTLGDIRQFEFELNKIGINTRDPFWARLGARLVNASESEFGEFIRSLLTR